MTTNILRFARRSVLAASWFLFSGMAFAVCDDDGKDDEGNINANVTNSACVNGQATGSVTETGGGGVNTPAQSGIPPVGLKRNISGGDANELRNGSSFNVPMRPGQTYKNTWTKGSTTTLSSVHTLVKPTNVPKGYKVQVNQGDGAGWISGNKIDLAQGNMDPATINHTFRIVRPIREPGKVGDIMLVRAAYKMQRGASGGETAQGMQAVPNGSGGYLYDLPTARFLIPLGTAFEDEKPITAGDLIFHCPLYTDGSAISVVRNLLSYEGIDRTATGVEVLTDSPNRIRQVKSPELFIDAVTISTNKFELRFYTPAAVAGQTASPLYAPTGTPHAVWTIERASASGNYVAGVRISESKDGVVVRSVDMACHETTAFNTRRIEGVETEEVVNQGFTYTQTPYTSVTLGGGTVTIAPGVNARDVTVTVKRNGTQIQKTTERFILVPNGVGEAMINRLQTFGTGTGDTLETQYWGGFNASAAGSLDIPPLTPFMEYYPDGSWVRYQYNPNGTLDKVYRPYEGAPARPWDATDTNCYVESYTYSADPVELPSSTYPAGYVSFSSDLPAIKTVTINGATKVVSKEYTTYHPETIDGKPVLQTVRWDYSDATHYVENSEKHYHATATGVPAGMPYSRTSSTGQLESFTYQRGNLDRSTRMFTPSSTGFDQKMTKTVGTTASPNGVANKTSRTVTIKTTAGTLLQESTEIYTGGGYETATVTDYLYDANHRLVETRKDGHVIESIVHNGLEQTITSEEGIVGSIVMDLNGRVAVDSKVGGISTTNSYSGRTMTKTTGGLVSSRTIDQIGRVTSTTDTEGRTISYSYPNNGKDREVTYPGNKKVTETNFPGGRVSSVTGPKVIDTFYAYGINTDGSLWTKESKVTSNNVRWTKTTSDWLGKTLSTEIPAPSGTGTVTMTNSYGAHGFLVKASAGASTGLADRLYEYDEFGEVFRTGTDLNGNGTLDVASGEPITEYDRYYEKSGSDWYGVRAVREYKQNGSATPTTLQIVKSRLSALSGGTTSRVVSIDANGVETVAVETVDRPNKTSTVVTTRSDRQESSTQVSINGLIVSTITSGDTQPTQYQYDSLDRLWKTTNARTGSVTTNTYNALGQLEKVTDEALARDTTYAYYASNHSNAGQVLSVTDAESKVTYFSYNDLNQLTRTWGSAAHPEQREYNSYGELVKTHSYRAGTGWANPTWPGSPGTPDTTTMNYYPATGLLKDQTDAAARKVEFTWKDNGNLHTRKNARTFITTYGYDNRGIETSRTYSDGTPSLTFTPDRSGRIGTMTDAAGTRDMTYSSSGMTNSVAFSGTGVLSGLTTTFGRDATGRHNATTIAAGSTILYSETRDYEANSGRLGKVMSGTTEAQYAYTPNSNYVGNITWRHNSSAMLGQTREHDEVDRLKSIRHIKAPAAGGPVLVSSFTYQYDLRNRRQQTTFADGSFWDYDYNDRGELILADKKLAGGSAPYAGQQYRYTHDNGGNALTKESGGDASGSARRSATYTANNLNQRATQPTPATFDVIGSAPAATPITVNGNTASRQGDYFRAELTASNTSAAVWNSVSIYDGTTTINGFVLVPPASVTPTYDFDGNLLTDGVWTYTWDAENRLTSATRNLAGVPYRKVTFTYDGFNRLIQRQVQHASGGPFVSTEKYVYEASKRLLTLDSSNQPLQSFHWGLDASGTTNGVGGTGGLLWLQDHASSVTHLVCMDGNFNVTHLVNASTGATTAAYEYSPYGELLRMSGSYALANPFRFSTQPQDNETGLLYYGLRHYKPEWGKWLSRDPMGAVDGLNLYAFVGNDPINNIDVNGASLISPGVQSELAWWGEFLNPISQLKTLGECATDPQYYREVGHNYAETGKGFVNGAKGAVDGVKNLPQVADFIASGKAAAMVDRLMNDPEFRDAMAKELGKEFCDWIKKMQTNDGAFQQLGEEAFNALSGAALGKLLKALEKVELAGKLSKRLSPKAEQVIEKCVERGCFMPGTLVATATGSQAIETLTVGQRVLSDSQASATDCSTAVDPQTWRKITLRLQNPQSPSTWLDVVILRPLTWIEESGCKIGAVIPFHLDELDVGGPAEVLSVEECPAIAPGPGRLVLATVTHVNGDIRALRLAEGETIELTGSHRVYSLDRGDWIATREIAAGETLKTHDGKVSVASVSAVPGKHRVYNIEVEADHSYFAGQSKLLSHNTKGSCSGLVAKSGETGATKAGRQAHKDWNPGEGFEKEVTLPSGKRADAVNFEQQHVKELKPDNPRAVKRGEKQVEQYRQELQEEHGGDWTSSVETYKRE